MIASLGTALGRGASISVILVMTVLPQLLLMFDKWIDKTELTRARDRKRAIRKEEAEA